MVLKNGILEAAFPLYLSEKQGLRMSQQDAFRFHAHFEADTWMLSLHSSAACLDVVKPRVSSRTEMSLKIWQKNGPCFENLWSYFSYPNKRSCLSDCEQGSCRELQGRLSVLRFHVWSRGTFTGLEGSLRVIQFNLPLILGHLELVSQNCFQMVF